ncbi:MAG TPA: hypothetical protein VLA79_20460 [Polyangia bacterium]|jgi:hypothetical protein|nr:hypothetical protein [Polyangia bacterium]
MKVATISLRPAQQIDYAGLAQQVIQPWADAYETWRSGVSDMLAKSAPKGGCQCEKCRASQCGPGPCACRCCVSDADLLLETRVGERRVISLEIDNTWRRPRDIELELSTWTATPQGAEVAAQIIGPTSFTLDPCSDKLVVLEVSIGAAGDDQRELPDVTTCVVAYADLRIKGCDIRSVRLAVAILPRDCDAYKIDCACGCC